MLLAVEGGGFFSSSASGYSHGLALLLLGKKNEEKVKKPVKVSPFNNQYQHLVRRERKQEQEEREDKEEQNSQLASCKCTIFGCFGCDSKTLNVKKEGFKLSNNNNNNNNLKSNLKSNLKRDSSERCLVSGDAELARESVEEQGQNRNFGGFEEQGQNGNFERRKVQWTDTCGKELVEIREFEASERGASDDESENETFRKCECAIM